ncbi:hypothetical protein GKZ89_03045 [Bacillus mangrovi]|uniref:Membrane protein YqhR n=1 Tax=Metabacillus mangrovi TaxID=1491830 RepID=A0A7X2S298_9BACI|nr:YqhR family membrane protein [Metabacillus mangrovi]MTH52369.1 hypothetical protein [Metabacillus mangrovi]
MENQTTGKGQDLAPASILGRVALCGFAGGLFWSAMGFIAFYFKLTEISPNMILQPVSAGGWKDGMWGSAASLLIISFLSIGAAFVYYALLKKFHSIWAGILYGIGLWAAVFFLAVPLFPVLKSAAELSSDTTVTVLCLYILYGTFIGYSISYDYQEIMKEVKSKNSKSLEENS